MNETNNKDINFEVSIKRLDEISASLERENVSLEDALTLYEEGVKLVRICNEQLESAERKIKLLKMSPDGEMIEEDLISAKEAE
ncbi:MAG: exodeoxyribonuclease VII small subunit [Ruminococcaceae bacterium]|nr:exodeoxyribonuclease VII small subunit [Oscillospiraceae bacterium]